MNKTVDQFTTTAKDNLTALQSLAAKSQADSAKLVKLNLATWKDLLAETFETAEAMMAAKDLQALMALQVGFAKPVADIAASYAQQVQTIVSGASTEFNEFIQQNLAEAQKTFTDLMQRAMKNSPAGTESVVALLNNATKASQEAFKTVQTTAQQVVDATQTNVVDATKQVSDAVKKSSK